MNYIERYEDAMNDYIGNAIAIKMSDRTVDNYTKRLNYFEDFWKDKYNGTPKQEPLPSDVRDWRDSLLDKGLKVSTVRQYMTELESFFSKYSSDTFADEPVFSKNPVSHWQFPRQMQSDIDSYDEILSDSDICKLWRNDRPARYKGEWVRNYCIVVLGIDSKLRNMEILNLTPEMIDFKYKEIEVIGKGSRRRIVDISDISVSALLLYMEFGRPETIGNSDLLFGTTSNKVYGKFDKTDAWHRGSPQWLSSLIERHVRTVTGVPNVRSHDLRHLGSRVEFNSGESAESLQGQLGHASLTTTQLYSGRLLQRRGRESALNVLAERDRCAAENYQLLEKLRRYKEKHT